MYPIQLSSVPVLRPRSSVKTSVFSLKPLLLIVSLLFVGAFGSSIHARAITTLPEDFGVKEYDDFHRVLHHLQHEALPKNDIATIRSRAKELIKLGDEILKLGVPEGTKAENVESFKKELATFRKALDKYGADAESGSDADLKKSYSAVHDSFEELAGLLPRK